MAKQPKIILYDIETLPMTCAVFSLYPDSINHENILSDWSLISVCWKELGKKTIYSTSLLDDPKRFKKDVNDDILIVKKMREVFEDADIIIGHNSKKFDTKRLNSRLIFHGLDPLPSGIQQIDTLQEVRKVASFSSNRLDYLGKHLLEYGKMETSRGLWLRILKGDISAVKEMVAYNKTDVQLLEDVYLKLRPYMKGHPHIGALEGNDRHHHCPKCGSDEFVSGSIKKRMTAAGLPRIQKRCAKCFGYSTFSEVREKENP
jgi:predicted nucleic-acid-binding Zn-ribbon protein